jgi:hypothetical protein
MDENAGTELEAGFDRLGWTVERLLVMAHHRPMYETSDDVPAREYTEDEIKPHRQAYVANEPFGERAPPPSVVTEQLMRRRDVIGAATTSRAFGAEVDGEVVSFADMYSDGRTAQIEDVGTRNTHLRKGLSRAVMKVAIEAAAGHEFLFLVADDRDWPKDFYARLGFDPIGITYEFFRPIAGSAAPSDPS